MIYRDSSSILKRILEVREFLIQIIVIFIGIFSALFYAALFGRNFPLIISSISFFILGILVIISKRSLINISENGPMKEVSGNKAVLLLALISLLDFSDN